MQSVTERQTIAASRDALVASLRKSHQKLAEKLSPMADDAGFSLTMGLQSAADNKDLEVIQKTLSALADNELAALQAILELRAESNLMLGILVEAADLPSIDLLPPVKDRFTATAGRLGKSAAAFKNPEASKLVDELVKTGKDAGNIFELKQRELVAAKAGANVVTENRALAQEFEKEVASLRKRSEAGAATAVREFGSGDRAGTHHPDQSRADQPSDGDGHRLVLCRARRRAPSGASAEQHEVDCRRRSGDQYRDRRFG